MKPSRHSYLVLSACLLGHSQLFAQATWIGADAANWNDPANWSGTAPVENGTCDLIFNNASNRSSTNGIAGLTVSSLGVLSSSRDNTINGNDLTLAGDVTDASGSWQWISCPVAISGTRTFDVSNGQLFMDGVLSDGPGTGAIIKAGGSWLVLRNNGNTFSGGATVNAGTLELAAGNSGNGVLRGTVTVNSGGTLISSVHDSFGFNEGIQVKTLNINDGTVTHSANDALTLASAVVNMTGGTLQATGGANSGLDLYNNGNGSGNTAIHTLASGNTATIAGKLNLRAGDNDSTGTLFTVADGAAAVDLQVSAGIANGGAQGTNSMIQKSGDGLMELSGSNSYSGGTRVNGGTLRAGSTQALGSNSALAMADTAGATLDLNNNNNSIGSLSGGGATGGNVALGSATLTIGGDNTSPAAYAGIISGIGALEKTGSGTLVLSGKNTFSGGTTLSSGTLQLSASGSAGVIRGTVTVNAGATLLSTANDSFGYGTGTKVDILNIVGGTVTHNAGGNNTLSSAVINLTGGTLQTTGSGSLDFYNNGSGNTAINTLASDTSATLAGKINLRQGDNDPTGTVFTVADGAATNDLIVNAALVNGPYQGGSSVVQKSGPGQMVLTGANTYTGATLVNEGTLALLGGSQAAPLTVASGACLGFALGSATSSTSSVTWLAGAKVKITGSPASPTSYTLMTATSISGTPELETPLAGYHLVVEGGNVLKLNPSGFSSWVTNPLFALAAGDQGAAADPDHDGLNNLLEYVLSGNPATSDSAILPTVSAAGSNLVFTYNRLDLSLADTTQTFQYGSDLNGWTNIIVPPGSLSVGAATITVTNNGTTDSVSISIPKTEGATSGKLFGRLQVTQP